MVALDKDHLVGAVAPMTRRRYWLLRAKVAAWRAVAWAVYLTSAPGTKPPPPSRRAFLDRLHAAEAAEAATP